MEQNVLTRQYLEEIRALAAKQLPRRSAKIIIELLDEIDRLGPPTRYRSGAFTDHHAFPYTGPYFGTRLCDVPDQYLAEWESNQDDVGVVNDVLTTNFRTRWIATRRLALYDYIKQRADRFTSQIQEPDEIPSPQVPLEKGVRSEEAGGIRDSGGGDAPF